MAIDEAVYPEVVTDWYLWLVVAQILFIRPSNVPELFHRRLQVYLIRRVAGRVVAK